jgi:hypothetical protein
MIFNPLFKANLSSHLFNDPKKHYIIRRKTTIYDCRKKYMGFLASLGMTVLFRGRKEKRRFEAKLISNLNNVRIAASPSLIIS